jgi:hypothetical protein
MKANELARRLSGIELGDIGREAEREAAKSGLVIVYGDGRDLVKFIGAIEGMADLPEGGPIHLDADGLLPDADDVPEAERAAYYDRKRLSYLIDAEWQQHGFPWSFTTAIPHHRFVVMNEGTRYCRGIVFEKSALGGDAT